MSKYYSSYILASSWSMIPLDVVRTMHPDWHVGRRLVVHISISHGAASKVGLFPLHLLSLPDRLTTVLPAVWLSMILISPMWPCFIIMVRDWMVTFGWGQVGACLLPHFSALYVDFQASARTFMCTIVTVGFSLVCYSSQSFVYYVCLFGRLVFSTFRFCELCFYYCVHFYLIYWCFC